MISSQNEAKEKLGKVDLSDIDSYKANIKKVLSEILYDSQNEKTENDDSEKKSVGVKLFGNPSKKSTKGSSRYGGLFSK